MSERGPARLIGSVLAWILAVLLAFAFTLAGGIKLLSNPGMVQEFAQIGLGQWFRYLTGFLEVTAAIGLLIPKVRFWAALQIATVMLGATFTNVLILHLPGMARVTGILIGMALASRGCAGRSLLRGARWPMREFRTVGGH